MARATGNECTGTGPPARSDNVLRRGAVSGACPVAGGASSHVSETSSFPRGRAVIPLSALVLLLVAADAPITRIMVHPDRARIERTMQLEVHGTEWVELPLLPGSTDADSIRVDATGAQVLALVIRPAGPTELPVPEARRLLQSLTQVEAQLAEARVGVEARDEQRSMLETVRPAHFEPSDRPIVLDSS